MLHNILLEYTKDDLDKYLKALAKEYRRRVGKHMKAEIIIVGGGSILINYNFRNTTVDIDAYIQAASGMKDAIIKVAEDNNLSADWLNSDMKNTTSFTNRIIQFSEYYREYSNVLTIRTVSAEYLVAMKLMAGRRYKHDYSDIIGVLLEHNKANKPITLEMIDKAVINLYDSWDDVPERSCSFINSIMKNNELSETIYNQVTIDEYFIRNILHDFNCQNPGVLNKNNVSEILDKLVSNVKNKLFLLSLLNKNEPGALAQKSTEQNDLKTLAPLDFKDSFSEAIDIYTKNNNKDVQKDVNNPSRTHKHSDYDPGSGNNNR